MPSKIALVIHSLAGGGAERVAAQLANYWAKRGLQVVLITLDSSAGDRYGLHDGVKRVGLGLMRESRSAWDAVRNNALRLLRLRRAIRESQAPIAISFTEKMNVLTLIACWPRRVGVIICERTDPRHHQIGRQWAWLRRRSYRCCRSLVVQTTAVQGWGRDLAGGRPVYVIPNAAADPAGGPSPDVTAAGPARRIVALGRLSPEKGYDLLVAAFAKIAGRFPGWILQVWGEGAERPALEQLCRQLGVEDRVQLPGWTAQQETALGAADLFVLPSLYEGFPNALLEAMAHGLACVSFDCDSGPREIIRDGVDGLLVPPRDVDALADALARLMSDETLRQRFGEQARQVTARFSSKVFFLRWDAVVEGASEQQVARLGDRTTALAE